MSVNATTYDVNLFSLGQLLDVFLVSFRENGESRNDPLAMRMEEEHQLGDDPLTVAP